MKKILSLVLVAAMMLSLVALAPTASAETTATVAVTDAVASKGDTVTLDIIISGTVLGAFGLVLDYDTSRLENAEVVVNTENGMTAGSGIAGFDYAGATFNGYSGSGEILDFTEETLLATVTLTVKEDAPAGDAYVRVSNVPDTPIIFLRAGSDPSDNIYDWNVVDGNVTVLPEGYSAATPESDAADFTYTDNGDGTATITAYNGSDAVVSIPSTVGNGLTVTTLGSLLFGIGTGQGNASITSVTIPSTVTTISDNALWGLSACTSVYVKSTTATVGANAIGFINGFAMNGSVIYPGSVNPNLTIYGYADTPVATYATTNSITFSAMSASNVVTIVAGENTSAYEVSGNTVKAPGASRADGRVTVAWDVNGTKVAPGAEVAIDGDTTFTAITVAAPETTYGASIKAADGYAALRFTAEFSIEEYDALVAAFGAESVKHGMLISTQDQIKAAGEFTHNLAKKIDFEMKGCWKKENGNYVFAASVKEFSASTLAKNYKFNAVAYVGIDLDDDGTVDTYVYGDYDWTCARDAKTILTKAIEGTDNSGLVGDQITWAEKWLAKFN